MTKPTSANQNFNTQFYNLQGIHINERMKNFNKLLYSCNYDQAQGQIKEIEPRNFQEKIFYVDALIYFRSIDKLFEILKDGNGLLTSKIFKQSWFFQQVFNNMTEEHIVNEVLPSFSYSLRLKLLKKLALNLSEEKMDKMFDLVLERYGLFIAKQYLFSCSSNKFSEVLKKHEITFTVEQLKRIMQKDIGLLKVYFKEYKKNTGCDFDDVDFLTYLAWKYPDLYFELDMKSKSRINLGRATTKAVLKANKDEVLKDLSNMQRHLSNAVLTRKINDFGQEHFYKFFPDKIEHLNRYDSYSTLQKLLSKYPIKKRWEVLSQGFKKAYNEEVINHLNLFGEQFGQFFPEEIRNKWAQIKYTDKGDLSYIQYYNSKEAVDLLKEKINLTSDIQQRGSLLSELFTVCYKNKDYVTYKEMLQYVCTRHRNDDKYNRKNIINHIHQNIDYKLLSEEHWNYINEIIDMQRVRKEYLSYEVIYQYLVFLHKNKLPLTKPIIQYIKDCHENNKNFRLYLGKEDREAECVLLKEIARNLSELQLDKKKNVTCQLFADIANFNKEGEEHAIKVEEFPLFFGLIKEVCTKKEPYEKDDFCVIRDLVFCQYVASNQALKVCTEAELLNIIKTMSTDKEDGHILHPSVISIIKKSNRGKFENELLHFYLAEQFEEFNSYEKKNLLKHLVSKEPETFAKYLQTILPCDAELVLIEYVMIKKCSHLGLDEKVISYIKPFVSVDSACDNKLRLLNALSRLMSTEAYLEIIKEYTPQEKRVDLQNEEQRKLYKIRCGIASTLKNLDSSVQVAPTLMNYCKGDYLQSSLTSLYKVLYNINEERARYYIEVLGNNAVSARKHAVFLGFELLCMKSAINIYTNVSSKEENSSAKKHVFSSVLKYFLKNPIDSLADEILLNMNMVDKNDSELIKTVTEAVQKVTNGYKPFFIEKVWNFLELFKEQEVNIVQYQKTLLNVANNIDLELFGKISEDFCKKIIDGWMESSIMKHTASSLNGFVLKYLQAYQDDQHFEYIFSILKMHKDASGEQPKSKDIFSFFENSYCGFYKINYQFTWLFKKHWEALFTEEEAFFEHVLLRLVIIFKQNRSIDGFSSKVDIVFKELYHKWGPFIADLLADASKRFYYSIYQEDNEDFNLGSFCLNLLKSNQSDLNCFIASTLIKDYQGKDELDLRDKVVIILKNVNSPIARIYGNVLLYK